MNKSEEGVPRVRLVPLLVFVIVVGIWSVNWILIGCLDQTMEQLGQSGDAFGAINPLFSGLAFAGVIFTIQLQRKEMVETREELKRQAEATLLGAAITGFAAKVQADLARPGFVFGEKDTPHPAGDHYREVLDALLNQATERLSPAIGGQQRS